mmetsp:Transcript_7957/g.11794  ORF Transcript_7957/g.11794 Transcript_7957/m.11794 type:complete len:173 (+) Transcript_7957:58-576(+)
MTSSIIELEKSCHRRYARPQKYITLCLDVNTDRNSSEKQQYQIASKGSLKLNDLCIMVASENLPLQLNQCFVMDTSLYKLSTYSLHLLTLYHGTPLVHFTRIRIYSILTFSETSFSSSSDNNKVVPQQFEERHHYRLLIKKASKSSKSSPTKSRARKTLLNSNPFITNSWTH